MLLARGKPDHVAWAYFLNWATQALNPSTPGRHDQSLAERVSVPCCAGAGFKRDARARGACSHVDLEERINANRTGEPVSGAFKRVLRAISFNFHISLLSLSRALAPDQFHVRLGITRPRSEEHTSELQSLRHLV